MANRQNSLAPLLSVVPAFVRQAGLHGARRFVEFFTTNIRNGDTRQAYARAVRTLFRWYEQRATGQHQVEPTLVAAYLEQHPGSAPTKKQALAAIRKLFDCLLIGRVVPINPVASVRGPKHVVKIGKPPVLDKDEMRVRFKAIDTSSVVGLRDRALIALMSYSFARVGTAVAMRVEDYFPKPKRWWVRLHEKGSKEHEMPANHCLEEYLNGNSQKGKYVRRLSLLRFIRRKRTWG